MKKFLPFLVASLIGPNVSFATGLDYYLYVTNHSSNPNVTVSGVSAGKGNCLTHVTNNGTFNSIGAGKNVDILIETNSIGTECDSSSPGTSTYEQNVSVTDNSNPTNPIELASGTFKLGMSNDLTGSNLANYVLESWTQVANDSTTGKVMIITQTQKSSNGTPGSHICVNICDWGDSTCSNPAIGGGGC